MYYDKMQVILVILISIIIANYIYLRWSMKRQRMILDDIEGFANPEDTSISILGNEHLFDTFYAKVYDIIVDGSVREDAETTLTLSWAKSYRPEEKTIEVLDIGCGTGDNVNLFAKAGCGKVIGLDAAPAMIERAQQKYPKLKFAIGEAEQIGQFAAAEFNLITLYYFTYYYLRDPDMMFRNAYNWLQPGGCLVLHLVNREKFDPILESASPFVAFSVQKYSKERITKSRVSFDKFDYEADFNIEGDRAEFREEFRFKKTGKRRQQIHHLRMPKIESIVARAEENGFVFKQTIDLTSIGYEYQYLFCFVR